MGGPLTLAAAGFASGWMLAWMAAGLIPIAIHLLTRRKQVSIDWAAIDLLRRVIERESKRVRFEQLLLLALRVLILLILALALARPFLVSDQVAEPRSQRAPRLWVFAIDASLSMGYRVGNVTRFDIARQRVVDVVEGALEGDAFSLLEVAKPTRAVIASPTFDKQNMLAELRPMLPTDTSCDFSQCVDLIRDLVDRWRESPALPQDVHVVILSDMGNDAWENFLTQPEAQSLQSLSDEITLEIVALSPEHSGNCFVRSVSASTNRATVGSQVDLSVEVENATDRRIAEFPVQFEVNGVTMQSRFVELPSFGTETVTFSYTPNAVGFINLACKIPDDLLSADDQRLHVLEVREQHRILLLENRSLDSELVRTSLAPVSGVRNSFQLQAMSVLDLVGSDLDEWDAIYAHDLRSIDEGLVQRLRRFVDAGGALILAFGPNTNSESWNSVQGGVDLLGYRFLTPSNDGDWDLDPLDYHSPIVQPFLGYPEAGLVTTPIFRYWQVAPSSAPYNLVDLSISNGDPLIVRKQHGGGTVLSLLSAPQSGLEGVDRNSSWNAIATWASFVPLMQKTVLTALDSDGSQYNTLTAEPIRGPLEDISGNSSKVIIQLPDGSERIVYAELNENTNQNASVASWEFTDTLRSGIYTARPDISGTNLTNSETSNTAAPFAVNVDTVESSLQSIDVRRLPLDPATFDGQLDSQAEDIENPEARSVSADAGYFSRAVLCTLLALLLTESTLAWFIGRRVG